MIARFDSRLWLMPMSFEALNLTWFEKINASQNASNAMIDLAIFIANDVLYLLILFLLFLWFYGDQQLKERALRAVFFYSDCTRYWFYYFNALLPSKTLCNGCRSHIDSSCSKCLFSKRSYADF